MNPSHNLLFLGNKQPPLIRFSITTVFVAFTTLARIGMDSVMPGYTFILYYPMVFIISSVFGWGAGLLATCLSAVIVYILWISPRAVDGIPPTREMIALIIFMGSGVLAAAMTKALHQALDQLAAADRDKEVLLHEVYHRVRNDMQALSMSLNIARMSEENRLAWIDNTISHIGVLSNVYHRLRHRNGVAIVSSQDYIEGLVRDLQRTAALRQPVSFRVTVADTQLGVSSAVPMGIIINELVTNALKYAFPDGRPGLISIILECADGQVVLTVKDNGVGIATDQPQGTGQGSLLIQQLAAQIDGTIETVSDQGVTTTLRFPVVMCRI